MTSISQTSMQPMPFPQRHSAEAKQSDPAPNTNLSFQHGRGAIDSVTPSLLPAMFEIQPNDDCRRALIETEKENCNGAR